MRLLSSQKSPVGRKIRSLLFESELGRASGFPGNAPRLRSFVFKEVFPTSPLLLPLTELAWGMFGLVQNAKHNLMKVKAELIGSPIVESRHQNMDNTNYTKSLSIDAPRQYQLTELFEVLADNLVPFADEYCLGKRVAEYPLYMHWDGGISGIGTGYRERLVKQVRRFEDKINSVGKHRQRAEAEVLNAARLEHWQSRVLLDPQTEVGTKLTWFSPPGFRFEGYHGVGKKHHSFIWVYEKKKKPDDTNLVTMTQFKCYPTLGQLGHIQAQLRALQTQHSIELNQGLQLHTLTSRNRVIAEMIELPPSTSMAQVEEYIYETEDTWPVQASDLPQLTEQQHLLFEKELTHILDDFLIPMYREILSNRPDAQAWNLVSHPHLEHQLSSTLSSTFWHSHEYKNMIRKLDNAFALTYQALLKWVENCALEEVPGMIKVKDLRDLYATLERVHSGEETDDDRKMFDSTAPLLLSVGSKILGVGQCGLGMLLPTEMLKKLNLLNRITQVREISPAQIRNLTAKEKLTFKNLVLEQYKLLVLTDKKGVSHNFWIRKEVYSEYEKSCHQVENGDWVGKCEISLTNGEDEYVLTDTEYQDRLSAAVSPAREEQVLEKISALEKIALAQVKGDRQESLQKRFARVRKALRPTISITQLMNADYIQPPIRLAVKTENPDFFSSSSPLHTLARLERAVVA